MSIEGAIHHFTLWSDYYKGIGNMKEAVENQQVAEWLQELKERREKESRREEVIRDPDEPYAGGDITPREVYESVSRLSERIIELLPNIVDSVISNMPDLIEEYLRRKEESK